MNVKYVFSILAAATLICSQAALSEPLQQQLWRNQIAANLNTQRCNQRDWNWRRHHHHRHHHRHHCG